MTKKFFFVFLISTFCFVLSANLVFGGCPERDDFSDFDQYLSGSGWLGWHGKIVKCVDNRVIVSRDNKGIAGLRIYLDRQGGDREVQWIAPLFKDYDGSDKEWIPSKGEGYYCYDLCPQDPNMWMEFECPDNQFLKGFKFVRVRDGDSDEDGMGVSFKCGDLGSSGSDWDCWPNASYGDIWGHDPNRSNLPEYCIINGAALAGGGVDWNHSGTFEIGPDEVFSGIGFLYDYHSHKDRDYINFNIRTSSVSSRRVKIKGHITDQDGNNLSGIRVELCEAGEAFTGDNGWWEKEVDSGTNFCVRLDESTLPSGWQDIDAINHRCDSEAESYEYQVADEDRFVSCEHSGSEGNDLAKDNEFDFRVEVGEEPEKPTVSCSSCSCGSDAVVTAKFDVDTKGQDITDYALEGRIVGESGWINMKEYCSYRDNCNPTNIGECCYNFEDHGSGNYTFTFKYKGEPSKIYQARGKVKTSAGWSNDGNWTECSQTTCPGDASAYCQGCSCDDGVVSNFFEVDTGGRDFLDYQVQMRKDNGSWQNISCTYNANCSPSSGSGECCYNFSQSGNVFHFNLKYGGQKNHSYQFRAKIKFSSS